MKLLIRRDDGKRKLKLRVSSKLEGFSILSSKSSWFWGWLSWNVISHFPALINGDLTRVRSCHLLWFWTIPDMVVFWSFICCLVNGVLIWPLTVTEKYYAWNFNLYLVLTQKKIFGYFIAKKLESRICHGMGPKILLHIGKDGRSSSESYQYNGRLKDDTTESRLELRHLISSMMLTNHLQVLDQEF